MGKSEVAKEYGVKEEFCLTRADGRIEWHCKHGVGHTIWSPKGNSNVHGCDGCCKHLKKNEK